MVVVAIVVVAMVVFAMVVVAVMVAVVASKLYGVNAPIIIFVFVFVLYCGWWWLVVAGRGW